MLFVHGGGFLLQAPVSLCLKAFSCHRTVRKSLTGGDQIVSVVRVGFWIQCFKQDTREMKEFTEWSLLVLREEEREWKTNALSFFSV